MEKESKMPLADCLSKRILIASTDRELVMRFSAALEPGFRIIEWAGNNTCQGIFNAEIPDLVLIDPKFFPEPIAISVTEISDAYDALRIIIIENQSDRQVDQYALFKAGAHGFCKENISDALLNKAVQMVCEGEYWIQRKLIAKMINDLAREITESHSPGGRDDNAVIDALTPRELEVAKMVRLGGNNKLIARELDISERTVKAHLSAIFRKLDVQNRLHLALYFSENN
jgi:two-component system nitrate/nitrite response regulator NarL